MFQDYYKFHVPGCLLSTVVGSGAINATPEADECTAAAAAAALLASDEDEDDDVSIETTNSAALCTVLKQVHSVYNALYRDEQCKKKQEIPCSNLTSGTAAFSLYITLLFFLYWQARRAVPLP